MKLAKLILTLATLITVQTRVQAAPVEIQLPAETGAFKQDAGAEIANGQCLTCHSVEYVSTQPRMPWAFWKASVQKMQQKYGAPIPDAQVEQLVDYLVRNYGVSTNATSGSRSGLVQQGASTSGSAGGAPTSAAQIATKYGCLGCHNAAVKIVGPPYKEIAAKYKNDAQAGDKIAEQIHKGGSGKWGPIIMPPFPQVTAEETKALTDWILALAR